jgi:hypothetical protein
LGQSPPWNALAVTSGAAEFTAGVEDGVDDVVVSVTVMIELRAAPTRSAPTVSAAMMTSAISDAIANSRATRLRRTSELCGVSFIADSGLAWQRLVTSWHWCRRAEATSLAGLSPAKQLDDNLIRRRSKREQT